MRYLYASFFRYLLFIGFLFSTIPVEATEPDFYIHFEECKALFAPLYLPKSPAIKVDDGEPFLLQCIRQGEFANCKIDFKDGGEGIKGEIVRYKIALDSPPFLELTLINGTENIMINTSQNAAVISSLMLNTRFTGSKVCHGGYFTSFQMKNMK
jgi:hypothetical protein